MDSEISRLGNIRFVATIIAPYLDRCWVNTPPPVATIGVSEYPHFFCSAVPDGPVHQPQPRIDTRHHDEEVVRLMHTCGITTKVAHGESFGQTRRVHSEARTRRTKRWPEQTGKSMEVRWQMTPHTHVVHVCRHGDREIRNSQEQRIPCEAFAEWRLQAVAFATRGVKTAALLRVGKRFAAGTSGLLCCDNVPGSNCITIKMGPRQE